MKWGSKVSKVSKVLRVSQVQMVQMVLQVQMVQTVLQVQMVQTVLQVQMVQTVLQGQMVQMGRTLRCQSRLTLKTVTSWLPRVRWRTILQVQIPMTLSAELRGLTG